MDEFNNLNQNQNAPIPDNTCTPPAPTNNVQGYTVTPQGGYYTRSHEDIIQDSPTPPQPDFSNRAYPPPPKTDNRFYQNNFQSPPPRPVAPKKEKSRISFLTIIIACALSAVIGLTGGITAAVLVGQKSGGTTTVFKEDSGKNVTINVDETVESVAQAVAEKVTPSVVGIRTTTSVLNFFGGSNESTGEGSGVIYTSDGYIITNYHVIESAAKTSGSKIEVFLDEEKVESYPATVVGYNISSDLAVIKIDVKGLKPVEIGDSSTLKTGQYVITIGCPGGLEFMGSVTYGIISGLDRTVSSASRVKLIQTDAAINPGNSGGALLNTSGQLIGINSSKIVSEEYEGMGFAIPVNTVIEKCDNIISRESTPDPYIGISISEKYTPEVLEYYGYPVGAVVLSVDEDSPAYVAGIRRGDIMTEFNGTELEDYTMLGDLLFECKPGQKVNVTIYRSGRYYDTAIKIGSDGSGN